jgi:uncharacterized protein
VSGLDSVIAKNIVDYRKENGEFKSRKELLKIEGLNNEIYTQSIGFLKILNADDVFDSTKIHPESYKIANDLLNKLNLSKKDIGKENISLTDINFDNLAQELNTDVLTLKDIAIQLKNPKADIRDGMSHVMLRKKPFTIDDLKVGMEIEGTVRNVVDFGAFVDLGVYHDGLIHISKMNHGQFVNHPTDILNVGDKVKVKILQVDLDKNRIQLYLL